MSKLSLIIAFLTLCVAWATHATPDVKRVEQEVLASFQSLVEASRALDAERYFAHFDKDKFVGLNSDGSNWNSIDELVPLIKGGFSALKEVKKLSFNNVKVSVIDQNTAILVNEFVQTSELMDGRLVTGAGGGAQVWSKRSGAWKLVSFSASNKAE